MGKIITGAVSGRVLVAIYLTVFLLIPFQIHASSPAGYSEYFIPGDEENLLTIFEEIGAGGQGNTTHAVISVTAWSADTIIYYDHWEDGYDFDPDDPSTADETVTLTNVGSNYSFESSNIPANPRGTGVYYDGKDRIYIAGGTATVSRASWTEDDDTLLAIAWEVYPVRPQLTTYIFPFGEDLALSGTGDPNLQDFERVFGLIQATEDDTTLTFDINADGNYGDTVCTSYDTPCTTTATSVELDKGEVFLFDRTVSTPSGATVDPIVTGTSVKGDKTLQVQYIIGDQGSDFEIRGLSAFPRGFWDDEYYAPVDGPAISGRPVDVYLHNPHDSQITISYESSSGSGSFPIDSRKTRSFQEATGSYVPEDSALYFKGTDVFWGISTIDSSGNSSAADVGETNDWAYSLVPAFLLEKEHFLGWAPGAEPVSTGGYADNSGIYLTPAQDNIRVYVDFNTDGEVDQTYDLDRLETQYIYDPSDGDMSNANIYATGPYVLAYGQNPDTADAAYPSIDVGYTTLPGIEWVQKVMTAEKTTDPAVVSTTSGSTATYTLEVDTYDFSVTGLDVVDYLPDGWQYVSGSTTITLASGSTITGSSANPATYSARTYADYFGSASYSNNGDNSPSGTNWSSNWIEDQDTNPSAGDVRIVTDTGVTPNASALWIDNVNREIARIADTSNVYDPRLRFDYRRDSLENGDEHLICEVCENATAGTPITCPGGWQEVVDIGSISGSDSQYTTYTRSLSDVLSNPNSTTLAVRFRTSGADFYNGYDFVYIDNVEIEGKQVLVWDSTTLLNMAPNQKVTIEFEAETTRAFSVGDITRNIMVATATRTVGGVTQTFKTRDDVFNIFGELEFEKTSDAVDPLNPGDRFTYTLTIENPSSSTSDITNIAVYDTLPEGVTYVEGSVSPVPAIRATEYYISSGSFTGDTYNLTLDQDLEENYFVIVRGAATQDTTRPPDQNYARLTADPWGTGDLSASSGNDVITLTRGSSSNDWVGVVTVVESVSSHTTDGFTLLDVQEVAHSGSGTSGTDSSDTSWSDIDQVMLMGGFYGSGCSTSESSSTNSKVCHARIWPSGSDTINWSRDSGDATLSAATSTVMALEWGSEWTVQRNRVQGNNGGDGADGTGEYNTASLTTSVSRENTWVWGTGHTNDQGIGDGPEGVLITLGDGVNQSATENTVAAGIEYANNAIDFEVYALTHDDIKVDYRFKADGDSAEKTVSVTVDAASPNAMGLVYNGSNGTGDAYPRSIFSARYTAGNAIELERQYNGQDFPAWVQGIDFTQLAGPPPNIISKSSAVSLAPGETLTITFDVTVDNPVPTGITEIVNTASVTTDQYFLPVEDSAVNTITNTGSASAEVGDTVWLDADGDGVEDVGEPGIANVRVWLKDQYGATKDTTFTNSQGYYLFTGVAAGDDYYVEVDTSTLPSGLTQSAPSSSHNNKSDTFDLAAGQSYLNADLGYEPEQAAIGDLVWSDADGDGIRDAGEPGIAGVTLSLYEDDGDGVPEPGGDDGPALDSTTTAADGTYLFSDVDADGSKDFFVYIDESQSALSGYTRTTPNSSSPLVFDMAAGDVVLSVDFGYQGPTYTISDKVWFDADNGGDLDAGESGISGVTVDLLDASSFVIASTTTDSSGDFSFSGLGNGNYRLRITDTGGKLTDYFGTTSYATARQRDITVSGANVSNTSFGYNLKGAIGDTLFNDVDGDQVQDSGEVGFSGISVKLYSDTDGDGVIESGDGDTLLATVVTDSSGKYLFSGLDNDTYIVSVESPPSGYTYIGTGAKADSDSSTSGQQQSSTISGGGNDTDRDFGYQAPVQRTISGTIWENDDEDDVIDGGESRFENVTVEIYLDDGDDTFETDGSDTLVNTVSSDASGDYEFTGLVSGKYWIRITDANNILSGYNTNYEVTEGAAAGSYNDRELVDVNSADASDINFGYKKPGVTFAVISSFTAYEENGQVVVQWETASEQGTVGFILKRQNKKTGKYKRLNKKMLPGLLNSPEGGTYRFVDDGAKFGKTYKYKLVELEASGKKRRYGPFKITVGGKGYELDRETMTGMFSKKARKKALKKLSRLSKAKDTREKNKLNKKLKKGMMAKITIKKDGIYFLDAVQVAEVLDISLKNAQRRIRNHNLNLYNQGVQIAWLPDAGSTGLYFYGQTVNTNFTDENIYWLGKNSGLAMKTWSGKQPDAISADGFYTETVHMEKDEYAMPFLFHNANTDYWLWDYVLAPYAGMDTRSFTVTASAPVVTSYGAKLKIRLAGASDTDAPLDHRAEIYFNGTLVGGEIWDGLNVVELDLDIDPVLINDGENSVELVGLINEGVPYSLIYLDEFDLSYPRRYVARDNRLLFSTQGEDTVTVTGFTDSDIMVFDITNPRRPKQVADITVEHVDDQYQVVFDPKNVNREYMAVAWDAVLLVDTIWADTPSDLKKRNNRGEYLIIAPSMLKISAQAFADYRNMFQTMIVDPEDIYDEFNYGVADPRTIRDFLAYANDYWRVPPRYVLLLGEGSYDYKDILGNGDNLLPSMLVDTPEGLYPSDQLYGDVAGNDGIPEIPVGRIPVVTDEEALAVLEKIRTFENGVNAGYEWTRKVLMLADNADDGGDFPADSDVLATWIPGTYATEKTYLSDYSLADARQRVLGGINNGAFLVNYFGHGAINRITAEGLLLDSDVPAMQNGHAPAIFNSVTCIINYFTMPGFDSLGEVLLLSENGGAAAVWAPSGLSLNHPGKLLNEALFSAVFHQNIQRMGDAVLSAVRAFDRQEQRYIPNMYILLGDPAMRIR